MITFLTIVAALIYLIALASSKENSAIDATVETKAEERRYNGDRDHHRRRVDHIGLGHLGGNHCSNHL